MIARDGSSRPPRLVVIGGCGRAGQALAVALAEMRSNVQVLDINPAALDALPRDMVASQRIQPRVADITLPSGLRTVDTHSADAFIAVTGSDSVNALAAQIAYHILGTPKVICRVDDPAKREMYEKLEITAISQSDLLMNMILDNF